MKSKESPVQEINSDAWPWEKGRILFLFAEPKTKKKVDTWAESTGQPGQDFD